MFFNVEYWLISLHAGTPVVVSQTTLTLMFVVLGILALGVGFGVVARNKENLMLHRWSMSVAVGLTVAAIGLVMLPAAYVYYTDPDLQFFSSLSGVTLLHAIIGVPTIATGLIYAFGDLPKEIKKWMRVAAILWVASLMLGVLLFLQMQDLLPIPTM